MRGNQKSIMFNTTLYCCFHPEFVSVLLLFSSSNAQEVSFFPRWAPHLKNECFHPEVFNAQLIEFFFTLGDTYVNWNIFHLHSKFVNQKRNWLMCKGILFWRHVWWQFHTFVLQEINLAYIWTLGIKTRFYHKLKLSVG